MPQRSSIICSNQSDFAKEMQRRINNPDRRLENLGELHDSMIYLMQNIAIFKESEIKVQEIEYGLNLGLIDLFNKILEANF